MPWASASSYSFYCSIGEAKYQISKKIILYARREKLNNLNSNLNSKFFCSDRPGNLDNIFV